MRVHIGGDHAAYDLKLHLVAAPARRRAMTWSTTARTTTTPRTTTRSRCCAAPRPSSGEPGNLGIVLGGSGNGEQIAANKVDGIRAALAWSEETAQLARMHNNAQIVSIGARMTEPELATRIVDVFLDHDFTEEARHQRRLDMVAPLRAERGAAADPGERGLTPQQWRTQNMRHGGLGRPRRARRQRRAARPRCCSVDQARAAASATSDDAAEVGRRQVPDVERAGRPASVVRLARRPLPATRAAASAGRSTGRTSSLDLEHHVDVVRVAASRQRPVDVDQPQPQARRCGAAGAARMSTSQREQRVVQRRAVAS